MMTLEITQRTGVAIRTKLLYWLMLGLFSTAFAQVLSGSVPMPFLDPAGPLFVIPVYLTNAVVGLWMVYRYGRPRFSTLYLAGVLFGMYESILTKVLWAPQWGSVLPIAEVGFVVLALFWHPLFAFMVPLAVVGLLGTRSRDVIRTLPFGFASPGRRLAIVTLVVAAIFHGGLTAHPVIAVGSLVSTGFGLWWIVRRWRRDETRTEHRLADFVPEGREVKWMFVTLGVVYVTYGLFNKPDLVPGLGFLVMGGLYRVIVRWFRHAAKRSLLDSPEPWSGAPDWWPLTSRRWLIIYSAITVAASVSGSNQSSTSFCRRER